MSGQLSRGTVNHLINNMTAENERLRKALTDIKAHISIVAGEMCKQSTIYCIADRALTPEDKTNSA